MINSIKDIIKNLKNLSFKDTQHLDDQGYLVLKNISFLKKNVDTLSKISEKLIRYFNDESIVVSAVFSFFLLNFEKHFIIDQA